MVLPMSKSTCYSVKVSQHQPMQHPMFVNSPFGRSTGVIPSHARAIDDGLHCAIDTYLKVSNGGNVETSVDVLDLGALVGDLSIKDAFGRFKCVDLDGNGVITRNEMQFFYEYQLHRMECMLRSL